MDRSFYDLLGVQPGANRRAVDRAWAGRRAVAGPAERARLDEAHAVLADPLRALRYAAYRNTPLSLDALASLELGPAPRVDATPGLRGGAPVRDLPERAWAIGTPPA